jgi:hypothetical protein
MRRMLLAVLLPAVLLASGCSASKDDLQRAAASGASAEAQKQTEASLRADVERLKSAAASPSSAPAPVAPAPAQPASTSCGGTVSAGGSTSCAFALSVASAYFRSGGGTTSVQAYSSVTGQTYVMQCESGVPVVCRGGNNAVVYIR